MIISTAIVFKGDINAGLVDVEAETWSVIIFKMTGFMCAVCFLIQGAYIAYYKSVIKVEAI